MHLSIDIIGDAFADVYCYLEGDLPEHGGDSRLSQPMHTVAGGSALNTATHLSSLLRHFWVDRDGDDKTRTSSVSLQTVINENDEYGRLISSHCGEHGFALINRRVSNHPACYLTSTGSQKDDKSTGHCAVIVSKGDRSFMTHLGCMEDFRGSHVLTDFGGVGEDANTSRHHHVHIAGFYNIEGFWEGELARKLAETREARAKEKRRMTVSLVPQQDATGEWDGGLLDLLQYVDFLILSEVEARNITKHSSGGDENGSDSRFLEHVADFSSSKCRGTVIIVTLGPKGAVAFERGEIIHRQETIEIANPADPTGAGDAFVAGFLHGYHSCLAGQNKSKDEADCSISIEAVRRGMEWGCSTGTCCVAVQGASVPSRRESIERVLSKVSANESKGAKRCREAE